ncbi:universal stress protein [soil metagenome]
MLREIFVPLLNGASDDAALDAAAALALAHDAHVSALVTLEHPLPLVSELGTLPPDITRGQIEQAREVALARVANAEQRLAREAISSEVRLSELMMLWSEETAAWQARHADLTVLGGADGSNAHAGLNFRSLLLRSGRPVLIVPAAARVIAPAQRPVLAWKPTPEATRAIHDALPLLAPGAELDVLVVDPTVSEHDYGEEPGAAIARHLARHGLRVRVVSLPSAGRNTGEAILQHTRERGADLLVMGGYGHSRWREVVLGGATHSALAGANLPVLFAH